MAAAEGGGEIATTWDTQLNTNIRVVQRMSRLTWKKDDGPEIREGVAHEFRQQYGASRQY